MDASGNVWVADFGNNTIREISLVNGVWTTSTPIGQGVLSFNQPATAVPLGTSPGTFGSATVFQPQAVMVSPNAPHDLFVTTNGGVAQATSIDGH